LTLARSCIWYLKLPQFGESGFKLRGWDSDSILDPESDKELDVDGKESYPPSRAKFISQHQFAEYAATHWIAHFKASHTTEEDEISADATDLCSIHAHVNTWSRISDEYIPYPHWGLLIAAQYDLVQALKILLLRGENIGQVEDALKQTALHVAAYRGNPSAANVLIEFNAPINAQTLYGDTPLHFATYSDSVEVVELLLSRGADVQPCNDDNESTALHIAAGSGRLDIVRALVNAGANVNALDEDFRSPLHLAAEPHHHSNPLSSYKSTIDFLIENGADPTLVDRYGKTAMQLASDDRFEYFLGDLGLSR
jgi:hypothetical protein